MSETTPYAANGSNGGARRPKTYIAHPKLKLTTPLPGVQKVRATCAFDVYMGNPRVVVRTNDPNEANRKDFGTITAAMDPFVFFAFMHQAREIIKAPEQNKFQLVCMKRDRNMQTGQSEIKDTASIWFGKDAEGVVFISVVAPPNENRPVIKFPILHSEYHQYRHKDGTPFSKAEASVITASGLFAFMEILIPHIGVITYNEADHVYNGPKKGGGGGGYGNRGGGYGNRGGGYNPPPPPAGGDDDLPF